MDEQNAKTGAPATYVTSVPAFRNHARASSSPSVILSRAQRAFDERQSLLRRQSLGPRADPNAAANAVAQPVAGGTVLGIHNLAIVMPQFLVRVKDDFSPCSFAHCRQRLLLSQAQSSELLKTLTTTTPTLVRPV
jgi:hypothetical protein